MNRSAKLLDSLRPRTGWSSVLLTCMLLLSVAWSIRMAQPTPGVGILTPVVIGGVLVGTLLGTQRWMGAGLAHAWSAVAGLLVTIFFAARNLTSLPSAPAQALADMNIVERMSVVRDWYLQWIAYQPHHRAIPNPCMQYLSELSPAPGDCNDLAYLFFAVTMALLMWLLSYICTWFVVRYWSWWGAVLPSGFALVFNLANATKLQDAYYVYLGFFMLCALLLAAQTFLAMQTERWREDRIGYGSDIGFDLLRDGLLVSLLVVGLAWLMPRELENDDIRRWAASMTKDPRSQFSRQMRNWFPTLSYPVRGGGNAFGTAMELGGAIELGSAPMFDVELPPEAQSSMPRYWRQAVFDTYDGQGWTRNVDGRRGGDDSSDWATDFALTVPVTQTVTTLDSRTVQLYAAPQPERFNLPVAAEYAGGGADTLTFESSETLRTGSQYSVVSRISRADEQSLRASAGADPEWIAERYLQLPPSITDQTHDLASQIAQNAPTRYDKARAIEQHLYRTIPYNERIASPPEGRDRVDWFLFEAREGYCDYYSSAFVVLARSQGVPARVAAGYSRAPASVQGNPLKFRQTAADAHTWPEVYFPEHGWIEFEPTAGDPALVRRSSPEDPLAERNPAEADRSFEEDMLPDEELEDPRADPPPMEPARTAEGELIGAEGGGFSLPLFPLLGLLAIVALSAASGWFVWDRPHRGLSPAASAFSRLSRLAGFFGLGPRKADTPFEYGQRLGQEFPQGSSEISTIVEGFVDERFGRRASEQAEGRLAAAWESLRGMLLKAAARLSWRRLRRDDPDASFRRPG